MKTTIQQQIIENQVAKGFTLEVHDQVKFLCKVEEGKNPHMITFWGNGKKPFANFLYQSVEIMEARKQDILAKNKHIQESKAKRKQEAKEKIQQMVNQVAIGDIYVASWGYEQTNLDFYQVVGKSGSQTFLLREIKQQSVKEGGCSMSDYRLGIKDNFLNEKIYKKRLTEWGFKIDDTRRAYKCDGKPHYCSWYY